ncbi:MAG: UDP-N-acetylmuramoyl-L-alanine--D-glutamate ligase [Peptostreptococcaceae bacterium]|jgi:UDP-N-acetylmuramoylalanine--D-glutamate ligase|nr:UDP-N-acetylmuramoyl-L-alanine--D-glutamate ligase [Peptostreptococcaceae bacterium]
MNKVLVVGLARTGVSVCKYFAKKNIDLIIADSKSEEQLKDILMDLKDIDAKFVIGQNPKFYEDVDLVVVSPGVPLHLDFLKEYRDKGIKIISEIELAYLNTNANFIGITGTNGKTTTTSLVGEIFKNANEDSYIVGNIGTPVIDYVQNSTQDSVFITELSSFQLESVFEFRPKIATILNVTQDHLNRHKTMKNYIDAKSNVFKNQLETDYLILNYDNDITRNIKSLNSMYFSRKEILKEGAFVKNNKIIVKLNGKEDDIIDIDKIFIRGPHNLENALAATLISYLYGIKKDIIRKTLIEFKGVEHRLEFVKEINEVKYINDSKGTNPDSSIKALNSYDDIILIAGGMDKNSDFDEFTSLFKNKVKYAFLIGETKEIIASSLKKHNFDKFEYVDTMEEAVSKSYEIAKANDIVLLSPACASWDMYDSYEVRGEHFKSCVYNLS